MKKNIGKFFSLFIVSMLVGQWATAKVIFTEVETESDWEKVLQEATAGNKSVFVDVYTDWCGYCKMMDRDVFADSEVGSYFNGNFINVKLDAETDFGKGFAQQHGVTGYPTYLFVDRQGVLIDKIVGYVEKDKFVRKSKKIQDSHAQLPKMEEKYKSGNMSRSEKMEYAVTLAGTDAEAASEIAAELLQGLTEAEMLNPDNLIFLATFVTDVESPIFKFVAENKQAFKSAHGQEGFESVVGGVFKSLITQAITDADEAKLQLIIEKVLPVYAADGTELAKSEFITRKLYYANIQDWAAYAAEVVNFHKEYGQDEPDYWYGQAYEVIEEYNRSEDLMKEAFAWLDKSLEEAEDFQTYYLYSYALAISGDFKAAKAKAQQAKDLATDTEQTNAADELMGQIEQADAAN